MASILCQRGSLSTSASISCCLSAYPPHFAFDYESRAHTKCHSDALEMVTYAFRLHAVCSQAPYDPDSIPETAQYNTPLPHSYSSAFPHLIISIRIHQSPAVPVFLLNIKMRASTFIAALAAPLLVASSPFATSLSPAVCSKASKRLSSYRALSTAEAFCTSYLGITPTTTTTTSTYTQPLTEFYGIISTTYASPDPPGTTTVVPNAVSGVGAGTKYVTSVTYVLTTTSVTRTDIVTEDRLCTTTEPAAKLAIQTACDCLGVTTPTVTATATATTTGNVTIVTINEVETVGTSSRSPLNI